MAAGADPDLERHARFSSAYPGKPIHTDGADMLAQVRPDIAIVCTGEYPRHDLALAAVDAGVKAIVLEKPMARTPDEARNMVGRAREKGVTMVVSHQMRFGEEFTLAREAIQNGDIGQPYFARASCYGQLMEQGTHTIDMLLYLLDEPEVDWVMGQVGDIEEGRGTVHPAPAFTLGYVSFANGMRAVIECGRQFQPAVGLEEVTWLQKRTQVMGTDGIVDSIVAHQCRVLNSEGAWRTLFTGSSGWDNATIRLYAELHDVLTTGGTHRNDATGALKGFEIMHALYQSAVVGDRVPLPLPEGAEPLEVIMDRAAE